ncbi:MAG: CopG family antitoxin [Candidatus Scalindua sp.]
MGKNKSSISKAESYKEISEFWDTHDLSDYWDETKEVKFDVNIELEKTYYAVDKTLSEQIEIVAKNRGVSADTLINLWIQEKLQQQRTLQE